jgi:predicted amidohydrolase YtcJ
MGIDDERPETWPEWWLEDPTDFTFEDHILREPRRIPIDGRLVEREVPTGVFIGARASELVTARPPEPSFEEDVESVRIGVEEMLRLGVTSIVDPASRMGYHMKVYQEAKNRGYLKLRISAVYEGIFNRQPPDDMRAHLGRLQINNLGDSYLRWRGVKVYGDGGVGTRSAWLSEPFAMWDELEGEENYGIPVVADTAMREAQFRAAVDHGWDLHTHSCGDAAMRQTMDLYKKLLDELRAREPGRDRRWSIIHAYFPIEPKTRVLDDMARYGVVATTNPVFNWQQGYAFATNAGRERMARLQPFRSYVRGGVVMASGSDYGVATHNPWMGFYALLTRKDQKTGQVFGPDETIGIEDALRSYTIHGAHLTYEEDFKGSLEPGKAADLVVLDLEDIRELERSPDRLLEMDRRVLLTLVDGEKRFDRDGRRSR